MATVASYEQSEIWWVYLLQGIPAVLIGVLLLTDPAATLLALVVFLGFYWLFTGVLELVRMFVDRSVSWVWSLLLGIPLMLAAAVRLRPFFRRRAEIATPGLPL